MNMRLLFAAGLIILTGCTSSAVTQGDGYYTLDLERTQLCYSGQNNCLNLELIHPSYNEPQIARAYQLPATTANWDVETLVNLMLAPPGQLYQTEQISDFSYRLPRNVATNAVWYYLEREQYELYESKGRHIR